MLYLTYNKAFLLIHERNLHLLPKYHARPYSDDYTDSSGLVCSVLMNMRHRRSRIELWGMSGASLATPNLPAHAQS